MFDNFTSYLSAEKIKRDCDQMFGFPWNVIVGESFDFDVEYDHEFCYHFFYGPIAVLAYKVNTRKFYIILYISDINKILHFLFNY